MIILQGNKIERSFSGDVLFDNINIQVDERDRIALVGRNGAGKSTLLKILVGEEAPTSGEINTKRDLNLSYLAQDSRFESSNTIYAEMLNVFADLRADEKRLRDMEMKMAELTGAELDKLMTDYDRLSEDFRQRGGFTYESDIRAILNGFKFDESMWEMPISDLSGGQNTRLALAKMLLEKPELLVLDEPTNGLDPVQIVEVRHLIKEIAAERAVMLSTHILSEVQATCDKIKMIEHGHMIFSGTMEEFNNYVEPCSFLVTFGNPPAPEELKNIDGISEVEPLTLREYRVYFTAPAGITQQVIARSVEKGWQLEEICLERESLDTIFARLSKNSK